MWGYLLPGVHKEQVKLKHAPAEWYDRPFVHAPNEQPEVDYTAAYGEQCADTDGLAAQRTQTLLAEWESWYGQSMLAKLQARAEQAERNLEATIRERDALRTELTQRMALPANALRHTK